MRAFPSAWRKIAIDDCRPETLEIYTDRVLEARILHMQQVAHMARKTKAEHIRPSNGKLADPFGSAPKFPGKYEVRFYYGNNKMNIHIFAAEYAAWHFIKAVINDNEVHWLDAHTAIAGDVKIKSKQLDLLMNYTPSTEEREWRLPYPYSYYAWHIATGEPWNAKNVAKFAGHDDTSKAKQAPERSSTRSKRASRRDSDENTSVSRSKRRVHNDDGTTFGIPELVEQFSKDASKIRAALRKSTLEKPAGGWQWPVAQRTIVCDALKKFLK